MERAKFLAQNMQICRITELGYMVTQETTSAIALAYESTEEAPHFEVIAFKVKTKIFLTMNRALNHITIRLTPADQAMYCEYNPNIIYPVPNKWGNHGWTHINLTLVAEELLREMIRISYCMTAPKKLAAKYEFDLET